MPKLRFGALVNQVEGRLREGGGVHGDHGLLVGNRVARVLADQDQSEHLDTLKNVREVERDTENLDDPHYLCK